MLLFFIFFTKLHWIAILVQFYRTGDSGFRIISKSLEAYGYGQSLQTLLKACYICKKMLIPNMDKYICRNYLHINYFASVLFCFVFFYGFDSDYESNHIGLVLGDQVQLSQGTGP